MPSTVKQLHYIGLRLIAWLAWLPFTGNLRHGRTWGELKRLRPREAVVLLFPLACYAGVAAWVYLFFPREILGWAVPVYATGIVLGGSLFGFTVVVTKVIDWSHVHVNR